jgi:hypothetical protein
MMISPNSISLSRRYEAQQGTKYSALMDEDAAGYLGTSAKLKWLTDDILPRKERGVSDGGHGAAYRRERKPGRR